MSITIQTEAERQSNNAEALSALLARHDIPGICCWVIRPEGVEGQLDSTYADRAAYDRIHQLAHYLDQPRVAGRPLHTDPPAVAVEASGLVDGVPVRFWTHLHDPGVIEEVDPR